MKNAVLSGKGGTGKTFLSVNLALAAGRAAYIDCDVEEPNGRLFLTTDECETERVFTLMPEFDASKCNGCRKCVEFCRFNALVYIKEKPMVFLEVCHSCGGCAFVCPNDAVSENQRCVGVVECGRHNDVDVVTGVLNTGEVSAVPVIKAALNKGLAMCETTIIDCPPGSGCSVMESVLAADCCIIVAEPTTFGFHNFLMVHRLVGLLGKPCYVVINKEDLPYEPLEKFCEESKTPILMRVPYDAELAVLGAEGRSVCEYDAQYRKKFINLLKSVRSEVGV